MVKAEICKGSYGYYLIQVNGHAQDPTVCSAISSIMWGLGGVLLNLKDKPDIIEMVLNPGWFNIEVNPFVSETDQRIVDTCYLYASVALMQIAEKYPQELQVIHK